MKIGARHYLGFGAVLLVLLVSGMMNYFNFTTIDDSMKNAIDDQYQKVTRVTIILKNVTSSIASIRDMILVTNTEN